MRFFEEQPQLLGYEYQAIYELEICFRLNILRFDNL